jgi:adenylosuccinate synthase
MLTAIVGVNWGDEGKGRMVDLLSESYDIVARYQGGNNAGHTVINEKGKFVLNLLPSGILREATVNVMGGGMAIDVEHLAGEIRSLGEKGVKITPDNLVISDKAVICLPFHKLLDNLEEDRLGAAAFGSTRRGIAPVYADKYMKKALRMEDLFSSRLEDKIRSLAEWKNIVVRDGYKSAPVDPDGLLEWLRAFGEPLKPFIRDAGAFLRLAAGRGKNIMFEAQLGALRDIDYGIYPFTSSSSTISAYAAIGSGMAGARLDNVIGVVKAYSSCVGEGPFTCEAFGAEADELRAAGAEYGAATGRPRRVGPFDVVASRYGCAVSGADTLALTKLDVMSYMEKIPVCRAYDAGAGETLDFPSGDALAGAKPVYEYLPGWGGDISLCRKESDLPAAALSYVKYVEDALGRPVKYVSVGAERGSVILR